MGELLDHIEGYLKSYSKKYGISIPSNLSCHLISRNHSDYYATYVNKGFLGITELGDRNNRGVREGVIKLDHNIYLGFVCSPSSREEYVVGFAETVDALKSYILTTSQEKVFTCDYEGNLFPHEIKDPPPVLFLNDGLFEKFKRDVKAFLNADKFYEERQLPQKRGALMYGPPGNGKTSMITWAATQFDKVFVIDPDDACNEVASNVNLLCTKEESKLIILEDLDSLNEHNSHLLNFVDGSVYIPKAYFIGTTNFPDKLHENILSRPSRFDLFLKVDRPNKIQRDKLLRHHIPNLPEEEYELLANKTKGLNASYFQEIATLKHSYEFVGETITIEEIIDECQRRVKINKTKNFETEDEQKGRVGFGKD